MTELSDKTIVCVNDKVSADSGQDARLIDEEYALVYGLNPVAAFVWKLMQNPISVGDIQRQMLAEFDVGVEECRKDLDDLLGTMIRRTMIAVQAEPQILSVSPRIELIEGFLSEKHCRHLMQLAENNLKRSVQYNSVKGEVEEADERTSYNAKLALGHDSIVEHLENRLARLAGIRIEHGEGLQITRYQIGQEFKGHCDYFDPALPGSAKALAKAGQRLLTVVIYLNTVSSGGETYFPIQDIYVKPKTGTALLFSNVRADGSVEPNAFHWSQPVKEGEKWIATKWLRERPTGD